MDFFTLLGKTLLFRGYVFVFLAIALLLSIRLMGAARTVSFFFITWVVAFLCEFSSTRTGFPFGWYFYNGSTHGRELYLSNVPFMDSLSFTFLLFASYCLSVLLLSPTRDRGVHLRVASDPAIRTSPAVLAFAVLLFVLIDMVIDPVALRGDRWFLGKIYYYPEPGLHFGVPLLNYAGWGVVGVTALGLYQQLDKWMLQRASPGDDTALITPAHPGRAETRPFPNAHDGNMARVLILGGLLYYTVVAFNVVMTFWIGELVMGWSALMMMLPVSVLLFAKLSGRGARLVSPFSRFA